jgi:ketosteroid isomerase-like protein
MRAAFLAYMADDAVLFRPRPVPGRSYTEAHASPSIELTWAPAFTAVATQGDLGYTTGPYEVHATTSGHTLEDQGYYVTIWRKQPTGLWKFVLDQGVATPPLTAAAAADIADIAVLREPGAPPAAPPGARSATPPAPPSPAAPSAHTALLAAERAFGADATAHGLRTATLAALATDARLYREGALPATNPEAIGSSLAAASQPPSAWNVTAAGASAAGDLGYTYGDLVLPKPGAPPTSQPNAMYLHLWQRQPGGTYRIVLDLIKALPPPAPSAQRH